MDSITCAYDFLLRHLPPAEQYSRQPAYTFSCASESAAREECFPYLYRALSRAKKMSWPLVEN